MTYHVAFVNLRAHGELDNEPGGVPEDEGGDEVPVDDVSQAANAPVRQTERKMFALLFQCFSCCAGGLG